MEKLLNKFLYYVSAFVLGITLLTGSFFWDILNNPEVQKITLNQLPELMEALGLLNLKGYIITSFTTTMFFVFPIIFGIWYSIWAYGLSQKDFKRNKNATCKTEI